MVFGILGNFYVLFIYYIILNCEDNFSFVFVSDIWESTYVILWSLWNENKVVWDYDVDICMLVCDFIDMCVWYSYLVIF